MEVKLRLVENVVNWFLKYFLPAGVSQGPLGAR
jgi:hypothetical protein